MTEITNGNLVFVNHLNEVDVADISELDRTGVPVQVFDTYEPYLPQSSSYGCARLYNGVIYYIGKDSTPTFPSSLWKLSRDGTPSDFISYAAISTDVPGGASVRDLNITPEGIINLVQQSSVRRFTEDGTFDQDFILSQYDDGFSSRFFTDPFTMSTDGQYVFGAQVSLEQSTPTVIVHRRILRWDLNNPTSPTQVFHTILEQTLDAATNIQAYDRVWSVDIDPISGDLFIAVTKMEQTAGVGTYTQKIYRVDSTDGTPISTYDVSAVQPNTLTIGNVQYIFISQPIAFDVDYYNGERLGWFFSQIQDNAGIKTRTLMSIDTDSTTVTTYPSWVGTNIANAPPWIVSYQSVILYQGLSLYNIDTGSLIFFKSEDF